MVPRLGLFFGVRSRFEDMAGGRAWDTDTGEAAGGAHGGTLRRVRGSRTPRAGAGGGVTVGAS